jgi:hypothetical protein
MVIACCSKRASATVFEWDELFNRNILEGVVMKLSTFFLCTLIGGLSGPITIFAQANNGAGEGKPEVHVDFYKLPPGRQDEWLALYKKSHFPMMKWQIDHGQVISETVYTRSIHQLSPSWDIAIMIVLPPARQRKKPELTRAQLMHKLYPDLDEYVKEERQRWAMTMEHWDERWVEVDIEKNPSLYYPNPD